MVSSGSHHQQTMTSKLSVWLPRLSPEGLKRGFCCHKDSHSSSSYPLFAKLEAAESCLHSKRLFNPGVFLLPSAKISRSWHVTHIATPRIIGVKNCDHGHSQNLEKQCSAECFCGDVTFTHEVWTLSGDCFLSTRMDFPLSGLSAESIIPHFLTMHALLRPNQERVNASFVSRLNQWSW